MGSLAFDWLVYPPRSPWMDLRHLLRLRLRVQIMRWKPLGDMIFLINPFHILPKVEFALLRDFRRPQRGWYRSCVGWQCWDAAWFRIYYWPEGVKAGRAEIARQVAELSDESYMEY